MLLGLRRALGNYVRHPGSAFLASLGWRLLLAWLVRTSFDPDEHWQGPEVAHRLVFGYGHLTWEWASGLRSILHPLVYAAAFWLLKITRLDYAVAVRAAPRVIIACVAAGNDVMLTQIATAHFGEDAAAWTAACQLLSWFNGFVLTRPFSNVWEAALVCAALLAANSRPRIAKENRAPTAQSSSSRAGTDASSQLASDANESRLAPACASARVRWAVMFLASGSAALMRPACAVMFVPVIAAVAARILLADLQRSCSTDARQGDPPALRSAAARFALKGGSKACTWAFLEVATGVAVVFFGGCCLLDCAFYGRWVFPPWEFVKFNVLSNASALYGIHPRFWYFTQGLPAMLASYLPLVAAGLIAALWRRACVLFERGHNQSGIDTGQTTAEGHGLSVAPGASPQCEARPLVPLWPAALALWGVSVFSALQHKEFRFVLAPFQLLLPYAGVALSLCSRPLSARVHPAPPSQPWQAPPGLRQKRSGSLTAIALLLVLLQLPMLLFFGVVHQRGTIAVMEHLARDASFGERSSSGVLFLLSCHATPFYAFLHANVPLTFLDCSPPGWQGATQAINRPGATGVFYVAQTDCGPDRHRVCSERVERGEPAGCGELQASCSTDSSGSCDIMASWDARPGCRGGWADCACDRGWNEKQVFMADPLGHLCRVYGCNAEAKRGALSTPHLHVVLYDSLVPAVQPFLSAHGYTEAQRFRQTLNDGDELFVVLFRRV